MVDGCELDNFPMVHSDLRRPSTLQIHSDLLLVRTSLPRFGFVTGEGYHRRLVDRARRRLADAPPVPVEAAPHLEELQVEDLQRGPGQRQLHPDEEGSEDFPVPTQVSQSLLYKGLLRVAANLLQPATVTVCCSKKRKNPMICSNLALCDSCCNLRLV